MTVGLRAERNDPSMILEYLALTRCESEIENDNGPCVTSEPQRIDQGDRSDEIAVVGHRVIRLARHAEPETSVVGSRAALAAEARHILSIAAAGDRSRRRRARADRSETWASWSTRGPIVSVVVWLSGKSDGGDLWLSKRSIDEWGRRSCSHC